MTEHDRSCIMALSQLFPELSPTERRVTIQNSILGQTTQEIAKDSGVDVETIKTHFKRSREKLKCASLQELLCVIMLRILSYNLLPNKSEFGGLIRSK